MKIRRECALDLRMTSEFEDVVLYSKKNKHFSYICINVLS